MNFDLSQVKLFAFDFDGTLVQSNHVKRQAFFDVLGHENEAEIQALEFILQNEPHLNRYGIFERLAEQFEHLDKDDLAIAYGLTCEKVILQVPEVGGAAELLRFIKESGLMAVINSATPQEDLRKIVAQLEIRNFVKSVYGSPASKTENLSALMQIHNLKPHQILVVGDGENDRVATENIGCGFYGITNEYSDLDSVALDLHDDLTDLLECMMSARKAEHV